MTSKKVYIVTIESGSSMSLLRWAFFLIFANPIGKKKQFITDLICIFLITGVIFSCVLTICIFPETCFLISFANFSFGLYV